MNVKLALAAILLATVSNAGVHRFYEIPSGVLTTVVGCNGQSCNIFWAPIERSTGKLYTIGYNLDDMHHNTQYHMWDQYDFPVYLLTRDPGTVVSLTTPFGVRELEPGARLDCEMRSFRGGAA
ncbi:MAG: hypothetical protein OXK76_09195 [Gammaproteobacteria bacterium]|nr:hypothetical protein [Gammaproteobacteria bacterium]